VKTVIVNPVLAGYNYIVCGSVYSHTTYAATLLFKRPGWLPLPTTGNDQRRNSARCGNVQSRDVSFSECNTGNGFLRFKDCALLGAPIVDEITSDYSHRTVAKTNG